MNLFKDVNTGRFVETSDATCDPVEFCNQGGGFICRMPRQYFHLQFTPAVMPPFQLSAFTLEWWPDYEDHPPIPGYTDSKRWNGWAVPYFTLENALEVARRMPDAVWFVPSTNSFWMNDHDDPDNPDGYEIASTTIEVDGQPVKVWRLGDGWCWDEVTP